MSRSPGINGSVSGAAIRGCAFALLFLVACRSEGPDSTLVLAASSKYAAALTASDNASRPLTIPALRMWQPAAGHYTLDAGTRIMTSPALAAVAKTFADDLSAQQGRRFAVATAGATRSGDIVLAIGDCDSRLGTEGYLLSIGEQLQVVAPKPAGIF